MLRLLFWPFSLVRRLVLYTFALLLAFAAFASGAGPIVAAVLIMWLMFRPRRRGRR